MAILNSVLALLAGIGVFIVGMNMLSDSLQKVAGPGMKRLIGKITNNRFAGVGIGAAVTGIIQSSAATTVMAIGFVNIGAMTLIQATAIIMGANIGTTVTGLLVALESLDIGLYASVLGFIGVMMVMFFKNPRIKNIGGIICGLGLIFVGLDLMSAAFNNAEVKDAISNLFEAVDFPLLLLLLGMVFTALMQSSSAMTGLVIVMVSSGALDLKYGLFIILGANIGTCVTALIATIGTSTNAKRTGLIHLLFNVIGVTVFTTITWIWGDQICNLLKNTVGNESYQVAIFHLVFNVSTTVVLIPFIKQLTRVAEYLIKDKKDYKTEYIKYIDELLLTTPAIALNQVKKEIENMAVMAKENLNLAIYEIMNQSGSNEKTIRKREEGIDYLNSEITQFLIKLSPLLDGKNSNIIGSYFHVVNDIERIGDYAENFLNDSLEMKVNELDFSKKAKEELNIMCNIITKMFDLAIEAFDETKLADLKEIGELEKNADECKKVFSLAHFERLSQSNCTMELGGYFTSIMASLERIGDHLVNIGFSITDPNGNQPGDVIKV